jgi:thiamine pyrophosphate-dependent acetolactate synthase large subunit-like protein
MKSLGKTRHSDFQDIDQSSIFRLAGLALSETVSHIDQLLPLVRNAFTAAISSNRCAHLAVPINVQQESVVARTHFCLGTSFQIRTCIPASHLQVEAFAISLCRKIQSNGRVLIACGYRANAIGTFVERLAELMHAPILTSFDGKGTVDERHALSYGVVGMYGYVGTSG